MSKTRRLVAVTVGVTALATAMSMLPAAAGDDDSVVTPVVEGLDGPRGVDAFWDGRVLYGQADGTVSVARLGDDDHDDGFDDDDLDEDSDLGDGVRTRVIGQVPPGFIAPAVAFGPRGRVWALTPGGEPGSGSNTLYHLRHGLAPRAVADIGAYQVDDPDPFNLADPPEESNPFGVTTLADRSVLVSDAAANDLLRVFPNGEIVTVARLKPRMVPVPDELPDDGFPPAGTVVASEAVATSVTVGSDGYYYVGELRGAPATPGTSQVWRIEPGSVGAVCDPEHPFSGPCTRYADGFTSIVDLAAGRDGSIYVLELVQQSWLQWELGLVDPPIGGLFRIAPHTRHVSELGAGQLVLPGGVDVSWNHKVYVTGPVFGPGAISRVTGADD